MPNAKFAMEQVVTLPILRSRTDNDDLQTWLDKQVRVTGSGNCADKISFSITPALFGLGTCLWSVSGGTIVTGNIKFPNYRGKWHKYSYTKYCFTS